MLCFLLYTQKQMLSSTQMTLSAAFILCYFCFVFFFHALCAKVYLSPRLCCPKSKSGPPQPRHSEAAQDARSLLLLIFLFPNLGHKYNFQVAKVRFPLHAHIVLPFPPQVAISPPSFYLGYCEMPILLLGKTSNLNVGSADADSGRCQLQVE